MSAKSRIDKPGHLVADQTIEDEITELEFRLRDAKAKLKAQQLERDSAANHPTVGTRMLI
jgi:hypothetical protein